MARIVFSKERYLAELVRGKTVLDVGCVNHALSSRVQDKWLHDVLCQAAASVTGIDNEDAEVKRLVREGYDVVCADASCFDLSRQFDVIVAGDVLEHLVAPGDFLRCCRQHLAPGGQLVLTTPNANCVLYFIENVFLGHELDNDDHVCIYTPTTIRTLLHKCQWDVHKHVFESRMLMHYQRTYLRKAIAFAMWLVNTLAGLVRPTLCRHFITIAIPSDDSRDPRC